MKLTGYGCGPCLSQDFIFLPVEIDGFVQILSENNYDRTISTKNTRAYLGYFF